MTFTKRLINAIGRTLAGIYFIPVRWFSSIFLSRKPLRIITGSDSSHFRSMLQLLNTLQVFEKGAFVIVYDLGLKQEEVKLLLHHFPYVKLKRFEYENYPAYYRMENNCGSYAWKPAIVSSEFQQLIKGEYLMWLDAGCFVTSKILLIRASIFFYGFYSPLSGPLIKEFTHNDTITKLGLHGKSSAKMLSGGLLGVAKNNKNQLLIEEWSAAGKDSELIAPKGSNKGNHRYDQSLLSLLFYKTFKTINQPSISKKWFEVLAHKDID